MIVEVVYIYGGVFTNPKPSPNSNLNTHKNQYDTIVSRRRGGGVLSYRDLHNNGFLEGYAMILSKEKGWGGA